MRNLFDLLMEGKYVGFDERYFGGRFSLTSVDYAYDISKSFNLAKTKKFAGSNVMDTTDFSNYVMGSSDTSDVLKSLVSRGFDKKTLCIINAINTIDLSSNGFGNDCTSDKITYGRDYDFGVYLTKIVNDNEFFKEDTSVSVSTGRFNYNFDCQLCIIIKNTKGSVYLYYSINR